MTAKRIDHTGIMVKDIETSIAFTKTFSVCS